MEDMIEEIRNLGGNIELGILKLISSKKVLYLVFQDSENPLIIYGLLLQHTQNNLDNLNMNTGSKIYVLGLDTTGFFKPRNFQSHFTRNITSLILKNHYPEFLEVFFHPKDDILFGKSSNNGMKGKLSSSKLLEYWLSILKNIDNNRKIHVFSSYYPERSFPYPKDTCVSQISLFDDDPKAKMLESLEKPIDIKNFYDLLLFRSDMSKGGLIYSIGPNIDNKEKYAVNCLKLDDIIKILQEQDFSNIEAGIKSSRNILEILDTKPHWFHTNNFDIKLPNIQKEKVVILKPKKKKT